MGPDPANPVSTSLEDFQKDLAINTVSAYAAAQAAVKGFKKLPRTIKKSFIYTGNNGNTFIIPEFLLLGIGKSSAWYLIQTMVATPEFAAEGYRFYFADERTPEGKAMHYTSGPGHADFFLQLAEQDGQGEPLATFVRGKGYVGFERDQRAILPKVTIEEILNPRYGAYGTAEARYGH
ncbi:hypothetical protein OCU04_008352 [Sclerotinia nivalis]|uniref:Uncharacterized protein n=1 Tax=Sclerotinia nivalis TaxID=352851 RepID=A0A9X0DHJ2_9HELO|nr:hypothetical protein OCU04_008352 [Sclerotinia nivalis]